MDTLDGFILDIFRPKKSVLNENDFENAWVCDLLNQNMDLVNEFIKFK